MSTRNDILYIGIGLHVAAIKASTGEEIWRTCLDPDTGAIRWENSLDGLGVGLTAFSDTGFSTVAASAAAAAGA